MTKKEKLNFIDQLFRALVRADVGNCGLHTDWDRYCDQIKKSEVEHRRWAPHGTRFGISVADAVKLFAVKYIVEFLAGSFEYTDPEGRQIHHTPRKHPAKDIFRIRLECFQGQALWEEYAKAIRKAISKKDARKFISEIDYSDLIR